MSEEYEDELVDGEEPTDQDEAYELDLDASGSADDLIQEAMAAVERGGGDGNGAIEEEGGDGDPDQAVRIAELEAEVRDVKERLVRTLADFDNFRRRSDREKGDLRRYAHGEAVRDLLGVLDNLERAVAAPGSIDDLKHGVGLIVDQFIDTLKRVGVTPIAAEGEVFDPAVHEAVSRTESDEVDVPTVGLEMQRGYRIHDRLLRPSMVTVTMPGSKSGGNR